MLERELKTVLDVIRFDDLGINDLDFGILKERILCLSEKFFEKKDDFEKRIEELENAKVSVSKVPEYWVNDFLKED